MQSKLKYKLESIDTATASNEVLDKLIEFFLEINQELFPTLSPEHPDKIKADLVVKNPYKDVLRHIISGPNNEIIGYFLLVHDNETSPEYESNKDIAYGNLNIKKQYRQQGIATDVIPFIKEKAKSMGAKKIEFFTCSSAGKTVAAKWNLKVRHEHFVNQMLFSEVDWDMIDDWVKQGPIKAPGVKLELYNQVPEADLPALADLYTETINQAPWGGDSKEIITPESYKKMVSRIKEKGGEYLILISREPNGEISGLTEVFYFSNNPSEISQELTGVRDKYRLRGLGKWLKAEMLMHIKKSYPQVKYVITGNAVANGPMLSINHRMGFKEINVFNLYQVPV